MGAAEKLEKDLSRNGAPDQEPILVRVTRERCVAHGEEQSAKIARSFGDEMLPAGFGAATAQLPGGLLEQIVQDAAFLLRSSVEKAFQSESLYGPDRVLQPSETVIGIRIVQEGFD